MKTQHTPGPWVPDLASFKVCANEGKLEICRTYGGVRIAEEHANARLIAAAPEMLAILKKWAIRVDDSCEDSFVINRTMTALEAREINAAIAKAEGRAE